MRKVTLLIGAGLGFVVGSRAGTGPYEQIEAKVRQVTKRPKVQEAVDQVKSTAADTVDAAAGTVTDKLPSRADATEPGQATAETLVSPPYAVP